MPVFWTAATYISMAVVNPALNNGVDWPWFIASQFIFGVVAALVVIDLLGRVPAAVAGVVGGVFGGLLDADPGPLVEPGNGSRDLVSGQLARRHGAPRHGPFDRRRAHAIQCRLACHGNCDSRRPVARCLGLLYGILLPKLPPIPGPFVWGGVLMPLLWTAASFSLMGVVNPLLQERVNWPWFVVSQFVFGVVAAIMIVRSEQILVPPAGGNT